MPSNEELVKLIQQGVDVKEYQEKLWNQNKGFVYMIIRQKAWYGTDIENDLLQQGYLGMMHAAMSYKANGPAKFINYAKSFIYGAMMTYAGTVYYPFHVPTYMKTLLKKHERLVRKYNNEHNRDPSDEIICQEMHINKSTLKDIKTLVEKIKLSSLDEYVNSEDKEYSYKDLLSNYESIEEAATYSVYEKELHKALENALSILDKKTLIMIRSVYYQGFSLKRTGTIFKCSGCYVSQRIERGFNKILNSEHRAILESFMWEGFVYRKEIIEEDTEETDLPENDSIIDIEKEENCFLI